MQSPVGQRGIALLRYQETVASFFHSERRDPAMDNSQ
jgi:hypothetical protein